MADTAVVVQKKVAGEWIGDECYFRRSIVPRLKLMTIYMSIPHFWFLKVKPLKKQGFTSSSLNRWFRQQKLLSRPPVVGGFGSGKSHEEEDSGLGSGRIGHHRADGRATWDDFFA